MNTKTLKYLLSGDEVEINKASLDETKSVEEFALTMYREGIVFFQDWKHLDNRSLYVFINKRLKAYGQECLSSIEISEESLDKWIQSMGFLSLSTMVKSLLMQYDFLLSRLGFRLCNIETGNDRYELVVVRSKYANRLPNHVKTIR